jgi:hypothetical protein
MIGASSGKHLSYWIDTAPRTDYPALSGDVSADVAVLGGGLVGLTVAVLLKRLGKTVAVVEMNSIAEGVTDYTTAKITSQQLIYDKLIRDHGEEKAGLYAEANEAAIARIESSINEKDIDCDFRRLPAYVYTEDENVVGELKAEVAAAQRVGLPASFVAEAPLPLAVEGAVRFEAEAQFHVRKYLLPLAEEIPGGGSHLFENTRALDVEEEGAQCRVQRDRGSVIAKGVIIATHIPFIFQGWFWGKSHPRREYGIAARIEQTVASEGISISAGSPTRSVRTAFRNGETVLIEAHEAHKAGGERATEQRYRNLEGWARGRFGAKELENRWSTQDDFSFDGSALRRQDRGGFRARLRRRGLRKLLRKLGHDQRDGRGDAPLRPHRRQGQQMGKPQRLHPGRALRHLAPLPGGARGGRALLQGSRDGLGGRRDRRRRARGGQSRGATRYPEGRLPGPGG